jgi:hypothetical protein
MEDGNEIHGRETGPKPIIQGLEIKRYRGETDDKGEHWILDEVSIGTSTNKRDELIWTVKHQPDQMPEIVNKLIDTGDHFLSRSVKYNNRGNWTDWELSSLVVEEAIRAIGEAAIPIIEKSNTQYAKNLLKKIKKENISTNR